ncbi:hypothetical protein HY932_02400 [Candidatus Falkowbacteria bacterium]|nr:hypothetical protein [Candidatus Falkowbacteria bacterium]
MGRRWTMHDAMNEGCKPAHFEGLLPMAGVFGARVDKTVEVLKRRMTRPLQE